MTFFGAGTVSLVHRAAKWIFSLLQGRSAMMSSQASGSSYKAKYR